VVNFQPPRLSSSNIYVITSTIPIYEGRSFSGQFRGVLILNFLATTLNDDINNAKVLTSGYCYLIDTKSAAIISHPKSGKECSDIKCTEGFSNEEYNSFESQVLIPLRNNGAQSKSGLVYYKGGEKWSLTYSAVNFTSIHYTIFVTVPYSEVHDAARRTTNSIQNTLRNMIIIFVPVFFIFIVILSFFSRFIIFTIIDPVNDLRKILEAVLTGDLSKSVINNPSSKDMKILLDAFSKV
jgi:sensor histidine kinase YesM